MNHRYRKLLRIVSALTLGLFVQYCDAQPRTSFNVAIVLWENVELLDFAGPGEVFAAAGFNVYTVSVEGQEILSQRFVTVKPQYSIDTAPAPDIVVFPGGGTSAVADNPKVLNWVKGLAVRNTTMMSVCTGAFVLNNASLLNGKNVTTHYGSIKRLQSANPATKVLENTRFVDNGNVLTTAGVSAGIDGALHLVSRIKGFRAAKSIARYMEYDKWDSSAGRVDFTNEYLVALRSKALAKDFTAILSMPADAPFEGELMNLASEFSERKMPAEAAYIYEQCTRLYPHSGESFLALNRLYKTLDRPAPIGEEAFMALLKNAKLEEAEREVNDARKKFPGWLLFDEGDVVDEAYRYFMKGDYHISVRIFNLVTNSYPNSYYAYYGMGEAYLKLGKKSEALAALNKSVGLNPFFRFAQNMLAELASTK